MRQGLPKDILLIETAADRRVYSGPGGRDRDVNMSVISIEGLTRDYGGGRGIFDLSFRVEQGEAFGFLGPNGAGKTTTIRHLMGFIRPKGGRCTIFGADCWTHSSLIQKRTGYIPGEISFFDHMTGSGFLEFSARYRGLSGLGRTKELLERLELNPEIKIRKMSKGMKQKTGIVAAFMHDPDLLILDEPTSGLDPLMQSRVVELLVEEKRRGKTILLSSHMFEEVERTCDRIGMIREGKMAAVDSAEAMRGRLLRSYQVALETQEEAQAFAADFGGVCHGKKVTVNAKPSLEEIFMRCYGEKQNDQSGLV